MVIVWFFRIRVVKGQTRDALRRLSLRGVPQLGVWQWEQRRLEEAPENLQFEGRIAKLMPSLSLLLKCSARISSCIAGSRVYS